MSVPLTLKLETTTWERDSHGLFDYESSTYLRKNFSVENSDLLIRHSDECMLASQLQTTDSIKSANLLLEVVKGTDKYMIQAPAGEVLWVTVKELKSNSGKKGYKLSKGDVIKLGRVKVKVKDMQLPGDRSEDKEELRDDESQSDKSVSGISACRICLSERTTLANPLASLCKCAGTMKFIHIECLKHWLKSKVVVKQDGATSSFYWKTLQCELCKEALSSLVRVNDRDFDLLEVPKPETPFIILEDMRRDLRHERCLHVTALIDSTPVYLGRSHESEIRISDISVSRRHASIRFEDSSYILEDFKSKFGTLIRMRRPLIVDTSTRVALQIGRTTICATASKTKAKIIAGCFMFACCRRSRTAVVFPEFAEAQDAEITAPHLIDPAPFAQEDAGPPPEIWEQMDEQDRNEIDEEINRVAT
mmetsp:Transcript_34470/g.60498  ORF Transcript_34470/g.60498 Transcript_34470/m.60498 type:complete len:420 (-) Transcript_34470:871-2130(-)